MGKSFEQGKEDIARLVQYFTTNREAFVAPGVKEAHVRQTLIDPLFEALGWDLRNLARAAPQYREVITEDSLDVEGHLKAPDYAFRVGTLVKFFAEAKKCGVNLGSDPAPAFQLRRYGWSAKVPLSILTDFEELAVYDCAMRPVPSEKASRARILYFRFEEYPERWRELWDVFSREAVWSGAFDQYAASKRKRGTSEVDVEFLKEIEGWRDVLARNIAARNPDLSPDHLNAAVQSTIDRVVFLRMAEDRGIEPYGQLLKLCERPEPYARFMRELCKKADGRYNSGLFHFQAEAGGSEAPDRITPGLAVDDKVFKPILQSLYFEHGSPYHFGVMPVEILGTVYERFLGKVIRLTAGHQAKVEEKPEVRKAGGVYYTPAYIVDYIVKQAVGKKLEGKSPAQLAGDQAHPALAVLDLACGSGSFLLGAYQCLLDHCLKWYGEHRPDTHQQAVLQDPRSGQWRLSIEEKKRILTTHLFGVDLDPQAVEVSKLSLLLKALEGEDSASLSGQLKLFHDRALPNLAANIKCGNSLIGPDYFHGKLLPDPDEMKRVNPFDWHREFPQVFRIDTDRSATGPVAKSSATGPVAFSEKSHRAGGATYGFDIIIGNPPYVRIQTMKEWAPLEVEIYKELFGSGRAGNYDIYVVFIEQGLKLLRADGRLGFICPHKFFNAKYGAGIRRLIAAGRHLAHVVHFGDQQVFSGATNYTCLLFLDRAGADTCRFVKVDRLSGWRALFANGENSENGENGEGWGAEGVIPSSQIATAEWNFNVGDGKALMAKLERMPVKLGAIAARIAQGIRTSANEIYVLDVLDEGPRVIRGYSSALEKPVAVERKAVHPFLQGRDLKRYRIAPAKKVVIIPYQLVKGRMMLLGETEFDRTCPKTLNYLRDCRKLLEGRERNRMRGKKWYAFIYPKNLEIMSAPKILVPDIADKPAFAYDEKGEYVFTSGYGITLRPTIAESPRYLLGLLNSRLLDFFLKRVSTPMRGGFFRYFTQYLEQLPIRRIDFDVPTDRAAHERMVSLVGSMLELNRRLAAAGSEGGKEVIQRQLESTEREIDRLVYELYALTPEEIAIVEGER